MDKALEKELQKGLKNSVKKIPTIAWFIVPCVLLMCVFTYALNFRIHAQATGGMLGENTGTLAGRALGSFEGLTKGQIEGYQAGHDAGLSGEDIFLRVSWFFLGIGLEADNNIPLTLLRCHSFNQLREHCLRLPVNIPEIAVQFAGNQQAGVYSRCQCR